MTKITELVETRAATGIPTRSLPEVLRTSVIGSYSVPDWLARFKTNFHRGRLSAAGLAEIEEVAIKAALVDQELAGVDIVSDGEYRRDNDVDYLVERIAGVEIVGGPKNEYFDYYDAVVRARLPEGGAIDTTDLVRAFRFTRGLTDSVLTVSLAGPFSLAKRLRNEAYDDDVDLMFAAAKVLRRASRVLVDAGATHIQLDEPFLAGYPEAVGRVVEAVNMITSEIDAHVALHVCYGNRYARPAWEGHYDFLFPAVLDARIHELVLEFARKGLDDLDLVRRYGGQFEVGVGVVDVKSSAVEPIEIIEQRLYQALKVLPPERIVVNPDCGLRHLPLAVARAKLAAMTAAAARVRANVLGTGSLLLTARGDAECQRTNVPVATPTPRTTALVPGVQQKRVSEADAPKFDVLGIGNAIVDMFMTVDSALVRELGLELGAMTLVDDATSERLTALTGTIRGVSGGSAANTVVGTVGFGGRAGYIAHVADDPVGTFFVEDFREAGVEFIPPSRIVSGAGSGRCLVLVTSEGERTMATYLGASLLIEPDHLEAAAFGCSKVAYLEGYLSDAPNGHHVLRRAVRLARAARAEVALALSDALCVERHRELFLELAKDADIVFANEQEAQLLSGVDDLAGAVGFFRDLGGVSVLTLGASGSVVVSPNSRVDVDPFPVDEVLDQTGAGDLYAGGFLFGWTHGADLATCGDLGSLAASEIVGHLGARPERSLRELMVQSGLHDRLGGKRKDGSDAGRRR